MLEVRTEGGNWELKGMKKNPRDWESKGKGEEKAKTLDKREQYRSETSNPSVVFIIAIIIALYPLTVSIISI